MTKYKFYKTKTEFCGFIIKLTKFNMDLKKLEQQSISNI